MNYTDIITNFAKVENESFTLSCGTGNGTISVKLTGKVDIPNPDQILLPALLNLDKDIVASEIPKIIFDIRELEFINSSGIKVFLQMVMNILNRHESQQYSIVFSHNPDIKIQKKSFIAISFLAPNLIFFNP